MIKALSKPKPKIRIKKNKSKEIKKDFYHLRHKFSKEEVDKYKKVFCRIKNYRHLSEPEIEETRKNFNELEKNLMLKKFHGDTDSVDYEDLDNYDDDGDGAHDDEYRKFGIIRTLFKGFDRDYFKPKRSDGGLGGINNYYIEYVSIDMKIYHLKNILL